jgi:hypothetical protein
VNQGNAVLPVTSLLLPATSLLLITTDIGANERHAGWQADRLGKLKAGATRNKERAERQAGFLWAIWVGYKFVLRQPWGVVRFVTTASHVLCEDDIRQQCRFTEVDLPSERWRSVLPAETRAGWVAESGTITDRQAVGCQVRRLRVYENGDASGTRSGLSDESSRA